MRTLKNLVLGAAIAASLGLTSLAALAKDVVVGVSWSNFQEERWKTDEAAIKAALATHGAKYISADAQGSPTKQLADVEDLISKGANVLVVLAMDSEAILPAVKKASDEGIPVIAYDRLIESPNVLYITFNNVEVGRMMAKAIYAVKPAGNYAFIKGDKGDPNADFLFSGITEVLKPAMTAGKIKNVGESYTDGWKPDNAQKNMEQILTKNNNKVDAVVCENDGMAGGVVAALAAQGMAGSVPVSGQDGDHAAITTALTIGEFAYQPLFIKALTLSVRNPKIGGSNPAARKIGAIVIPVILTFLPVARTPKSSPLCVMIADQRLKRIVRRAACRVSTWSCGGPRSFAKPSSSPPSPSPIEPFVQRPSSCARLPRVSVCHV